MRVGLKIALVFVVIAAVLGTMTLIVLSIKTSVDNSHRELRASFEDVEISVNNTSKIHKLSSEIEALFSEILEIPFLREANLVDEKSNKIKEEISSISSEFSLVSSSSDEIEKLRKILEELVEYQKKFIEYEKDLNNVADNMQSYSSKLSNLQKKREEFFEKNE